MRNQQSNYHQKILRLPYRGAPSTVGVISSSIIQSQDNYSVRELAEEICKSVQPRDYVSEPLAIYYFVCSHTRYMRDPRTVELVRDPAVVIADLHNGKIPQLDCDDMAALIGALCTAAGARVRIVVVAFKHMFYKGQRQYSHVFVQAQDPRTGSWLVLDPVAGHKTDEMLRRGKAWKIFSVT